MLTEPGDWFADRARVEREIAGALKSAIDAHGPINRENVGSAAKRVYSSLKAVRRPLLVGAVADEHNPKLRGEDTVDLAAATDAETPWTLSQTAYERALDQADEELVKLPLRLRLRVYMGGTATCDRWVRQRAAQILAEGQHGS